MSETLWYCVKTAQYIRAFLLPPKCPVIVVFSELNVVWNSGRVSHNWTLTCSWGLEIQGVVQLFSVLAMFDCQCYKHYSLSSVNNAW